MSNCCRRSAMLRRTPDRVWCLHLIQERGRNWRKRESGSTFALRTISHGGCKSTTYSIPLPHLRNPVPSKSKSLIRAALYPPFMRKVPKEVLGVSCSCHSISSHPVLHPRQPTMVPSHGMALRQSLKRNQRIL